MCKSEHYKFYSNNSCEYFPCHNIDGKLDDADFNCLFCYCPLYVLGTNCGGNFTYINEIKDCTNCLVPHGKDAYEYIVERFSEISEIEKSMRVLD